MLLSAYASQNGIKYFLISFVDLFGVMRAKLANFEQRAFETRFARLQDIQLLLELS